MQLLPAKRSRSFVTLRTFIIVLMALLGVASVSCSSSNKVVSKGLFQKRKYNKGFHANIHWFNGKKHRAARTVSPQVVEEPQVSLEKVEKIGLNHPEAMNQHFQQQAKRLAIGKVIRLSSVVLQPVETIHWEREKAPENHQLHESKAFEQPKTATGKRLNVWSVVGLLVSLLGAFSVWAALLQPLGPILIPLLICLSGMGLGFIALNQVNNNDGFNEASEILALTALGVGYFAIITWPIGYFFIALLTIF